jgi:hypothetical protein
MKLFAGILLIILIAISSFAILTKSPRQVKINNDFKRNYNSFIAYDTGFQTGFNLDILFPWQRTIIGFSMDSSAVMQIDRKSILNRINFNKVIRASTIQSISSDPDLVYFFDPNGHVVLETNFKSGLLVKDKLPSRLLGAVKHEGEGYLILQSNFRTGVALRKLDKSGTMTDIYQFENFNDNGVSHMGQLINNDMQTGFFYIPYYNSRIIHYDYLTQKISEITSIEKTEVKDRSVSTPYGRILSVKMPVINRKAAANDKYLFVLSYATSKYDASPDNAVVDMYSTKENEYVGSFPIPGIRKRDIRGFTCTESKLVICSNKKILFYDFN